jgi:hypothetical protein
MTMGTAFTMLLVVGTVWGGLITILVLALRKEREKRTRTHEAQS